MSYLPRRRFIVWGCQTVQKIPGCSQAGCDAGRGKLILPWHAGPTMFKHTKAEKTINALLHKKPPEQAQAGRSEITQTAGSTDIAENET
ncbi:hypothetical protein CEXT_432991 [Caerostris extrusa]|uniref:Uncharacterized protein n=1 Tax=Caerostris extrusa TaxID=172846 RepID=A0AAV4RTU0_CAEEX|nr:hypothetical protein CEXT_432991 [Caerostris extrusa]